MVDVEWWISFNVTGWSLFINVPVAMDCIKDHWQFISRDYYLLKKEFIKIIQFILNSTFFVFNSVIYRYNYGTLISSPYLSSVIADLVMRKLEVGALSLIRLPFYYRFVNDILLAAPASSVSSIVDIFNSQHPRLQITMEVWWYDRIFWMLQWLGIMSW